MLQLTGDFALPEHTYPLTTEDGFLCNIGIGADGPIAVYILEGLECGSAELGCQLVTTANSDTTIDVDLGKLTGGSFDYTVVVEALDPLVGPVTYTFYESCLVI